MADERLKGDLKDRKCVPCEGGTPPLPVEEAEALLPELAGWNIRDKGIEKEFGFKNYYRTMAFVNAVAWIAHSEGHHPDLYVSYGSCKVRLTTHAAGGLTENDFICAAKIDALL